jgi:hypothetical protein
VTRRVVDWFDIGTQHQPYVTYEVMMFTKFLENNMGKR